MVWLLVCTIKDMNQNQFIEVKDARDGFRIVETVIRSTRQHSGWESCTYRGKRYQVFGGVRTYQFIDLANPIKGNKGLPIWA